MGLQIEDGHGSGNTVKVDEHGHLETHSVVKIEFKYASNVLGDAYSWTAISSDIDAGDTALYVCNNSTTKNLYIQRIYVWSDTYTQFKIHLPAYVTPAGGTEVVGKNLNTTSGKIADATARADETSNVFAAANTICTVRNNEVGTDQFGQWIEFDGAIVLGYHKALAIDVIAELAAYECTIMGFYMQPEVD